jgi:cytochrome b
MQRLEPPIPVWDRLVRLLHWTLALTIGMAWTSTLGLGFSKAHEPAGYLALGAVTVRLIWGFAGSHYARFSQFVRTPQAVWRYTVQLREKNEARYIGHNPLGGWMILLLLLCVGGLGVTGWLYTTDYFWGSAWLDTLHYVLAWALLALIVMHVAGVFFTSQRQGENLVMSMVDGRKAAKGLDTESM